MYPDGGAVFAQGAEPDGGSLAAAGSRARAGLPVDPDRGGARKLAPGQLPGQAVARGKHVYTSLDKPGLQDSDPAATGSLARRLESEPGYEPSDAWDGQPLDGASRSPSED